MSDVFWSGSGVSLYLGDAEQCLRKLQPGWIHCCITSPPYWSLRSYNNIEESKHFEIGMEPVSDCLGWATKKRCEVCFVCRLVNVFREVKRVLRDDGTLWINIGDTIDGEPSMTPARLALALQADEWILRQDIIWYAPNKMPEPVINRCVKSHEHILLLAKSQDYYYDAEAIAEPANKRDVWVVPTKGYPGAHFATYTPQLITPCILAGTSSYGCCRNCGAGYTRIIKKVGGAVGNKQEDSRDHSITRNRNGMSGSTLDGVVPKRETIGWRKSCHCTTTEITRCVVLDPFVGSGTTVATAIELGRYGLGIDLSETYLNENTIPRINETAIKDSKRMELVPTNIPIPLKRLRGSS